MTGLMKFFVMALDAAAEPNAMDQAAKVVDDISGFVWNMFCFSFFLEQVFILQ